MFAEPSMCPWRSFPAPRSRLLACLPLDLTPPPSKTQVVEVVHDLGSKQKWLLDRLQRFIDDGDVLVFANQKARVDELAAALQAAGAK